MITRILLLLICFADSCFGATTYTEFYCRATGTNINAGSTTNATAANTYTSGDWNSGTGVFTKTGGDFSAVTVGMWASIYTNADTQTTFVGRITAVDDTADTLTLSLDAKFGAAPATTSGTISCKVGGAWSGPFGTVAFPLNYIYGQATNAAGPLPRVNLKNEANYKITAAITLAFTNVIFQGYTSVPGDRGKATIDGGASGSSYIVLTVSGKNYTLTDLIINSNGASGSASGLLFSGTENHINRLVVHGMRGNGVEATSVNHFYASETYDCDLNNSTAKGGFDLTSSGIMIRDCISHHNTSANACGFQLDGGINVVRCIAAFNGASGIRTTADVTQTFDQFCAYGNGGSGIELAGSVGPYSDPMLVNIVNSCLVSNVSAGIRMNNNTASRYLSGVIENIAFGTGTMTNQAGNFLNSDGATQFGTNFYGVTVGFLLELASGVTPWVAPETGDFRVNLAAVKNKGTNTYTQTYPTATWTGTVGYQDIGAAQHLDSGGTGASSVFTQ